MGPGCLQPQLSRAGPPRWLSERNGSALADGRVVTVGPDGWVLMWDPATPGTGPAELGRHEGWVQTVAVLADGRVVTGGSDRRVLIWDPARPGTQIIQLSCPVTT